MKMPSVFCLQFLKDCNHLFMTAKQKRKSQRPKSSYILEEK